mmetsp:Transcript_100922/g.266834  ORF Transcript_100922/g.266834 Transcript_100922/m.266834 type:complete len:237 (-) Transcript_100922:209-919(-)
MLLCWEASSIKRAWPRWISDANSPKVLAWPLPKLSIGMPQEVSIVRMLSVLASDTSTKFASWMSLALDSSTKFASLHWAWDHHSNLLVLSACLENTWNPASMSFSVWRMVELAVTWFFFACAISKRSTNSRRRSLMPALAPASFTSGWKSLSKGSKVSAEDLIEARKGWSMDSLADSRFCSLRSKVAFKKFSPSLPTLLGIFTCLTMTSSSPLNGKRPVTIPKMTTPRAHVSTFNP